MNKELPVLTSLNKDVNIQFSTLVDLLEKRGKELNDELLYIFLEDGENETNFITFGDMLNRVKAVSAYLQTIGKQGDRVLLLFPTGIEFITALFGCIFSGIIGVPSYSPRKNRTNQRFKNILSDSEPSIIFTTRKIFNNLQSIFSEEQYLQRYTFLINEDINDSISDKWIKPDIKPDDVAMLQYTSGSTGQPNGVMISHINILHNSEYIRQSFGFNRLSTGVNWLPNFHDMGLIGCLIQPIYTGFKNVIIPSVNFLQYPHKWFKAISKYKGTAAGGPNFAYDYCSNKVTSEQSRGVDFSNITTFWCGADPIHKETLVRFSEKFNKNSFHPRQFYPCYGLAESTLMVTGGNYRKEPIYFKAEIKALAQNIVKPAKKDPDSRIFVSCGYPWLGTTVVIANPEKSTLCEPDEIGEIWTSGPSVAKGYWNNPEETKYTFQAYLADTGEGPFLRTGDLGFIRDGHLYITGRLKDLIIIRGTNHYPQDIELTVEKCHPTLKENAGAAFSIDIADEERLVIITEVERTYMRNLNTEDVFEAVRLAIAEEHAILPYAIILIRTGNIPKTSSGKIQRSACKKDFLNDNLNIISEWKMELSPGHVQSIKSYSVESLREWLVNWLSQKRNLDPAIIDPDKPIAVYGLDSLMAVNLEKDVNEQFGVRWPIESFLRENTINQLVKEGVEMMKSVISD